MSPVIDRLGELYRHLEHLRELRPRVTGPKILREDLSLGNDVLRSLQIVCQVVIDIASELSARRKLRFASNSEAVENLSAMPEFPSTIARDLEGLPGFRNVLIHEYVALNYTLVVDALDRLDVVEKFAEIVRGLELTAED